MTEVIVSKARGRAALRRAEALASGGFIQNDPQAVLALGMLCRGQEVFFSADTESLIIAYCLIAAIAGVRP